MYLNIMTLSGLTFSITLNKTRALSAIIPSTVAFYMSVVVSSVYAECCYAAFNVNLFHTNNLSTSLYPPGLSFNED
jgi:hypothetical protein